MPPDDSLDYLRSAAQRYPELAPRSLRAPPPTSPPLATGAAEAPRDPERRFPQEYTNFTLLAQTRLSTTWLADHTTLNCRVVVKELADALLLDIEARARFQQEARIVARLAHPNIVPIRAAQFSEPPYFFTMPFIEGVHLDQYCQEHAHSWWAKLTLMTRICKAVSYAHQQGVIHRDLKPANILVGASGQPQVLDFGLGWVVNDDAMERANVKRMAAGTPSYMAPEQTLGLPGDARTDVYSLGAVLFELMEGARPIGTGIDTSDTFRRIRDETPLPLAQAAGRRSRELNAVVQKALSKKPAERYRSVEDFSADLQNVLADRPVCALPSTRSYRTRKWFSRNWIAFGIAVLTVAIATALVAAAIANWHLHRLERDRVAVEAQSHRITTGRLQILEGNPLEAAHNLHDALVAAESDERLDPLFPRFAMLEHSWYYPCIWGVPCTAASAWPKQIAWTADGSTLVTLWSGGRMRAWDVATRRELDVPLRQDAIATSLNSGGSGDCVLVAYTNGSIHKLGRGGDAESKLIAREVLPASGEAAEHIAVSADGQWLTVANEDSIDIYHDTESGWRRIRTWEHGSGAVTAIAFDPADTSRLLAAFEKEINQAPTLYTTTVYDHASVRIVATVTRVDLVRDIAFTASPDCALLAEKTVQEWNWKAGSVKPATDANEIVEEWGVRSLAVVRRGSERIVAYASGDGRIGFFNLTERRHLHCEGYHACDATPIDLAVSPDGEFIASCGCDGVKLWRLPPPPVVCGSDQPAHVSVSGESDPGWVLSWDPSDQREPDRPVVSRCRLGRGAKVGSTSEWCWDGHVSGIALSHNGQHLARILIHPGGNRRSLVLSSATEPDGIVGMLEWDDCRDIRPQWLSERNDVLYLTWQGGQANGVNTLGCLIEVTIGQHLGEMTTDTVHEFDSGCTGVAMDSTQQWLATCSEGPLDHPDDAPARVAVYRVVPAEPETATSKREYELTSEFKCGRVVWGIALLRDRHGDLVVATSGRSRDVSLWTFDGDPLGSLSGHEGSIFHSRRLTDRLLVTASRDHSVRIWDVWSQKEVCAFRDLLARGGPGLAVRDGRIAFTDNRGVHIVDALDVETTIEVIREFEYRESAAQPSIIRLSGLPVDGDEVTVFPRNP